MFPVLNDFRIQSRNFDLTEIREYPANNLRRVPCPTCRGQIRPEGSSPPRPWDFSRRPEFHPPELWVYIAACAETACGIALVLGICTRFAALGAAAVFGDRGLLLTGRQGVWLDVEHRRLRYPGVLGNGQRSWRLMRGRLPWPGAMRPQLLTRRRPVPEGVWDHAGSREDASRPIPKVQRAPPIHLRSAPGVSRQSAGGLPSWVKRHGGAVAQ